MLTLLYTIAIALSGLFGLKAVLKLTERQLAAAAKKASEGDVSPVTSELFPQSMAHWSGANVVTHGDPGFVVTWKTEGDQGLVVESQTEAPGSYTSVGRTIHRLN